jgi:glutathione S-transferase
MAQNPDVHGMMSRVPRDNGALLITVHHLGVSQSDRIVWLLEELGLPYRLKWHERTEAGLAPADYLALHPAATAPVIDDEGTALT